MHSSGFSGSCTPKALYRAVEEPPRGFHYDTQMLRVAHALPVKLDGDCGNARGFFGGLIDARLFQKRVENGLARGKIAGVEWLRFSDIDGLHVVQKPAPSDGAGSSPSSDQATFFSPSIICIGAWEPSALPIAILRGFIASGISRFSSIVRRPFLSDAFSTRT